ncbi:nuclear transport factor 2 family protein [Ramlibacter sp. AW1]|uniref:Nuclear transport factor 2 family protein n=1 Tax=Ramlibacter aurantiacus TaxID=2801330 RepID=A0A936ZCQ4_9BURK|nr:aromatic-ring-hydroxylating dioxygenase subunit beta [Ramlibacter aurantiacus]MBL0419199.1 nuclear transport factor 2 family protein [Ramlibacter aurantiacus]
MQFLPRLGADDRFALDDLYQAYATALDEQRYDDWPGFFRDDALYRIVPKDNFDLQLPIALMHCEGRLMMADRVTAIKEAAMIRPRHLRRFVTPARLAGAEGELLRVRANVLLVETLHHQSTRLVLSGVYHDLVERNGEGFRLAERICVYDSLLLPDSVVEPV